MSSGVAVSGATVEALQSGQAHATTSTSSSGTYALPNLATGSYDVRVSATNYQTQTQPGIVVTSGVTTTANFDLVSSGGGGPSGDTVTYYHTDAIGSVRMTTDATGQVIGRYDYLPFGVAWNPPTNPDVRQFTGQERDPETGFDYFGARYYQSQTGRFTSPDIPGVDQNPFDSQSWNLYAYVRNNPLRFVDPTGRKCENGYNAETGAFCTETIGEDPNRRANEAWQAAQQFFLESRLNFERQFPRTSGFLEGSTQAVTTLFTSPRQSCLAQVGLNTLWNLAPIEPGLSDLAEPAAAGAALSQWNRAQRYAASRPNFLGGQLIVVSEPVERLPRDGESE